VDPNGVFDGIMGFKKGNLTRKGSKKDDGLYLGKIKRLIELQFDKKTHLFFSAASYGEGKAEDFIKHLFSQKLPLSYQKKEGEVFFGKAHSISEKRITMKLKNKTKKIVFYDEINRWKLSGIEECREALLWNY
jgi:hypothetical protein